MVHHGMLYEVSENPEILLVEDDPLSGQLALIYLRKGYRTEYMQDAEHFCDRIQAVSYRCILLDINLGKGYKGDQLLQDVKSSRLNSRTPVIAITGHSSDDTLKFLSEAGFDRILTKPYRREDILDALASLGVMPEN